MTTSEIRKKVYDWFRQTTGRDLTLKEHKELKAFFIEYGKSANSNNHTPEQIASRQPKPQRTVLPSITKSSRPPVRGKCKYCPRQAGYGRIVCRDCAYERMKDQI